MLTPILVALTPFIVNFVTNLIKKLPTFAELRVSRRPVIRLLAGIVSFLVVTLGMWVNPGSVSEDVLATVSINVILSFGAWIGSIGTYHAFFEKKSEV